MLKEYFNLIILELLYIKACFLTCAIKQELVLRILVFKLKDNYGTKVLTIMKIINLKYPFYVNA